MQYSSEVYIRASQDIINWRNRTPLLGRIDRAQPAEYLPQASAGEVVEAREEADRTPYDQDLHVKELLDVMVFVLSLGSVHGIQPDFRQNVLPYVNGQGTHSAIYDRTHEMAVNLVEGNKAANINAILINLCSTLGHLPTSVDILSMVDAVIVKNSANRPAEYYAVHQENGQVLAEEDILAKYSHVEKMLRKLRNHFGMTLEPWMHQPFADLILDFNNAELNQRLLDKRLSAFQSELVNQMSTSLTNREPHVAFDSSHQMTYALKQMGAVSLVA